MGWFLRLSRQVHQDRFEVEAAEALSKGFSVLVFPEGSRSPDGRIQRFRNGAFEVARNTGVPVLPVVLDGSSLRLEDSEGKDVPLGPLGSPKEGPGLAADIKGALGGDVYLVRWSVLS